MEKIHGGECMKLLTPILLLCAFALSLFIRAILPHDSVFTPSYIAFAADDAVYHMRLVESLVVNFPTKIWFEPFTIYPTGASLHFGPLWTYMIAITSLILGLGTPSVILTQTIGAYFPAIFGALTVFPVYFIGREVFNKPTGILAAFLIAVLPGQILTRSLLGFTDHHIGEVFFSTLFLMFFIFSIKNSKNINFCHLQNINSYFKKPALIYSILAGVAFSLYLLQWSSGVFFGGIVIIFITLHCIILHIKDESLEGTIVVSMTTFAFALPVVLPFITTDNSFAVIRYSYLHVLITIGASFFFMFLYALSIKLNKNKIFYPRFYYPIALLFVFLFGIVISKLYIPSMYSSFMSFFAIFHQNVGGALTIAEASPPTRDMIFFNYPGIYDFLSTYYFAILAGITLSVMLLFKYKPEQLLFLTWCITIYGLTTGQNRWFYYYSVNVALLSSFFVMSIISRTGIKAVLKNAKEEITSIDSIQPFISSNPIKVIVPFAISILIIMIVFLPNYAASTAIASQGTTSPSYAQWHESMTWMRDNTPDPGLDYNAVYSIPEIGTVFQYPNTSYGVMSWWDYG
ncbi:MAG: oligosaccharyl transferase, archaeosortase A system-associated, partial [Candidatus Pacebacteria bacterium]|nr:oligosaccharyl transferase, archaeosortase A system-associated [Candidatus Paceibacterota bacterium]